jgi:aryl-alcohol dehydrogenase-like predicted oxidoreductase
MFFDPSDPVDCYSMLDLSIEHGINTFDTAHVYGKGKSVIFGKWLNERKMADQVIILAKGGHPYGHRRINRKDITADLEETFEWMQVDYADLYVLHRDDPSVPVSEIVQILNDLHRQGKIGAFGGSNWKYERIAAANEYARSAGLVPFTVSSPQYSLVDQVEEPWEDCVSIGGPRGAFERARYAESNIALFTWSSLAGGFFSGKYSKDDLAKLQGDRSAADDCLRCYGSVDNFERLTRAGLLAKSKGLTAPQVALAYLLHQPVDVFPIVASNGRSQFEANVGALNVSLSPSELSYLDLSSDAC